MAKFFLTAFFLVSVLLTFGQHVEVIEKSSQKGFPKGKIYAFIEPATDTSRIQFVATILARSVSSTSIITDLYFAIRSKANKLGANCYRIRSFAKSPSGRTELILDSYWAPDTILQQNTINHELNVVYVFGDEKEDSKAHHFFEVNGLKNELKPRTYYKYYLKEGVDLTLSTGGFYGDTEWLHWVEGKQPVFFTLSGFELNGGHSQSNTFFEHSSSVPFKSGGLNEIDNISLGLLLATLFVQVH